MTKTRSSKTKSPKLGGRKTPVAASTPAVERPTPEQDLVVFAFRLTAEERNLIHKAAGPAPASSFVRALAIAAARHDEEAIKLLVQSTKATA